MTTISGRISRVTEARRAVLKEPTSDNRDAYLKALENLYIQLAPEVRETHRPLGDLMAKARHVGDADHSVTDVDTLTVIFHEDWNDFLGGFEYQHNGVRIEIERARELMKF